MTRLVRAGWYVGAVLAMVAAVVASASATNQLQAPEISGSTVSTGLAALAGGILLVRARWGR